MNRSSGTSGKAKNSHRGRPGKSSRVGVERWVDDTLESFEAVATPTSAQERLWAGVVEIEPRWSTYQAMTERIIPVIMLDRT